MKLLSILILSALFLYVSNEDYKTEQDEQEFYCQMVKEKAWPNYERRDCE